MGRPDADDLLAITADALAAAGLFAAIQKPSFSGHVRWGNKSARGRDIEGVRTLIVQDRDDWRVIARVRVADDSDHNGHHDLGYAMNHKRTCTLRWRIAEGYVNGFRKRDILWYAITRWKTNHQFIKQWRAR